MLGGMQEFSLPVSLLQCRLPVYLPPSQPQQWQTCTPFTHNLSYVAQKKT